MGNPFFGLFRRSPIENDFNHARKVAQCGPLFVQAVACHFGDDQDRFLFLKEEIRDLEAEADRRKQGITIMTNLEQS